MFVMERREKILENLARDGKVRVRDLADEFSVTEDLIRKDLAALEAAGKLHRKYGGAVPNTGNPARVFSSRKKIPDMESKKVIAAKALSMIEPGMIIYLDISTANVLLAQMIAQSSLQVTVVTNMLEILTVLAPSTIPLIAIGGEMDLGREGFVGPAAAQMLSQFRFDLSFIGAVGIELENNALTSLSPSESMGKKLVLFRSARSYLVCESAKLKVMGNYQFGALDEIDGILMERAPDEKTKELLDAHLVEVI